MYTFDFSDRLPTASEVMPDHDPVIRHINECRKRRLDAIRVFGLANNSPFNTAARSISAQILDPDVRVFHPAALNRVFERRPLQGVAFKLVFHHSIT